MLQLANATVVLENGHGLSRAIRFILGLKSCSSSVMMFRGYTCLVGTSLSS
jgi:hypothetical protein